MSILSEIKHIVQQVDRASSLAEAMHWLVQQMHKVLQTDACSIYLLNKKSEYVLVATKGLNDSMVRKVRFSSDRGLTGWVGRRGELLNVKNVTSHPDYLEWPGLGEQKYKAFLGVPIIYNRRSLGVLVIQQEANRLFDDAEEAFLITVAAQIANVLAHAESTGQLQEWLLSPEEQIELAPYFKGEAAVSGVAIGQSVVVFPLADLDAVPERRVTDINGEIKNFKAALELVKADIDQLKKRMEESLGEEELALFSVYWHILDYSGFAQEVINIIKQGIWAQSALCQVVKRYIRKFEAMDDEYLQERSTDIRDLGRRILAKLQTSRSYTREYPEQTILLGEEVTASMLAEVPEHRLAGIVSVRGSSNAHVAILARAMGVPTVMGVRDLPVNRLMNATIVVDGYYGQVYANPKAEILSEFQRLILEEQELDRQLECLHAELAETKDGHRVGLYVNIGLNVDASLSMRVGAEGVGLYRSEISFMQRDRFPSEEEQFIIYRQLLKAFAPRPVVMRTLDVGGDKPLPYFPIQEDNPFLGWRGIRLTLDHPEVFLVQLRAMLRANYQLNNLKILLPMITSLHEIDEARRLLDQAYREVVEQDGIVVEYPEIGAMIEVPCAVYLASELAKKVDFVSVGSNDLIQYMMAVDRTNARVASLYDALHPALLRALKFVVDAVHSEGKTVSICGEMASDPLAIIVLLGLEFDGLSINSASLPRVKWVIRNFEFAQTRQICKEVLGLSDAKMVRIYLRRVLEQAGLGGLIRAGKH